jgi:type IV secretory pathway TrbD component
MLESAPYYQSLTRPLQVAGVERTYGILVIGGTCLLGVLGWYFHSILCAGSAFLLYSGGMLFLRNCAKKDPYMVTVAQRFYGYKGYYPARASLRGNKINGPAVGTLLLGILLLVVALLFGLGLFWWVLAIMALSAGGFLYMRAR